MLSDLLPAFLQISWSKWVDSRMPPSPLFSLFAICPCVAFLHPQQWHLNGRLGDTAVL